MSLFKEEQYRHVGAYGLLKHEGRVLMIKKERGAYRGCLDLPGGGIEFGEDPISALHREFVEETGLLLTGQTLLAALSNRVRHQIADDEVEDLHHLGLIYGVAAASHGPLKTEPDGEDSGGAVWVSLSELAELKITPFAKAVLDQPSLA